ncbi:MAG: hypothetical protein QOG41_2296 [Thermoleophilaceae bacterium]|jgi:hypothetical protein|nr:hypothetical protein [Thermoleophilaceae bacterium]MEA2389523.1 hypothetical protein [Thermoleophilaceae bacterium]
MWNTCRTVAAAPAEILHVLTHEDAIRRWSPVDFELTGHAGGRLRSGDRARVEGRVAGINVGFDVEVARAESASLELFARGPVDIDVNYGIASCDGGSAVEASVDVRGGRGMTGRVVATTVRALLAAGALDGALGRIAGEVEAGREQSAAQPAGDFAIAA